MRLGDWIAIKAAVGGAGIDQMRIRVLGIKTTADGGRVEVDWKPTVPEREMANHCARAINGPYGPDYPGWSDHKVWVHQVFAPLARIILDLA